MSTFEYLWCVYNTEHYFATGNGDCKEQNNKDEAKRTEYGSRAMTEVRSCKINFGDISTINARA